MEEDHEMKLALVQLRGRNLHCKVKKSYKDMVSVKKVGQEKDLTVFLVNQVWLENSRANLT